MTNANDPVYTDCERSTATNEDSEITRYQIGLTKREYFAALAMNAAMINPKILEASVRSAMENKIEVYESLAVAATMMADALIAELNK